MALRVCGASEQRDALSAARCWCRGLFCGRGGFRRSKEFRGGFPRSAVALTAAEFEERVSQADLFDGDQRAAKWRARVAAHAPPRAAKRKRSAAAVGLQDGVDGA